MTSNHNKILNLQQLANCIRFLAIDAVQEAKSGHPGMPMGMADIATVLFKDHLKFDPIEPNWADRDRFIISNGHGSMLLYATLYLLGYKDISLNDIKNFRQLGSPTAGHPEYGEISGIETTTGPLSQGLANGVGFALAEKILNSKFGNKTIDHYTYVFAGDGCLMEGLSHESSSLAGHLNLSKLIVFFDDNSISIDGSTDLSVSEDTILRYKAYGWETLTVDGHDHLQISNAIIQAKKNNSPTLISCKTKIGFGSPNKESSSSSHGSPLGEDEVKLTREKLNWPYNKFEIPNELLEIWRNFSKRNNQIKKDWLSNNQEIIKSDKYKEFFSTNLSSKINMKIQDFKIKNMLTINKNNFNGSYIYYGIREHGMAAIMNGMALHGGIRPFGGTFLVFSDYCRPSMRLAAMMNLPIIYVMTHDSIGLGEDGPTHQPVEHLSTLRAIPNLNVIRPADIIETMEAWQYALDSRSPTVLVLTRQNLPMLRKKIDTNIVTQGAYPIIDFENYNATVLATGSEVEIASDASKLLLKENIKLRVVSIPCWEIFDQQKSEFKNKILGNKSIYAIEAGIINGWEKYVPQENFIGMKSFGSSGPYKKLYKHFNITSDNLINLVKRGDS